MSIRLSHNSSLLLCLFAIDVHEQWPQNTDSAFNTIGNLKGYYFIQTGQNLSFFCNSLCALTKFHIRCYLWSNEFQLWREETTTTITAEAWGQCGVPRNNWMSLIVCPMRSRSQTHPMGIRNTVGLAISLAQVSFQIAFDCESNFSPFEHLDIIDWKQVIITFGSSQKIMRRNWAQVLFFISIDVNE